MKKIIPLLIALLSFQFVWGQITTPIVKANFGIEADLSSNFYNNLPQPAVDDWFSNNHPGTGQSVIDTTGAAAIVAGYVNNPATRTQSFHRLMRQAPYSIVNNRLLLDAIYHRDFHGSDSTVFAGGSNKNGMSPATWSCPVAQGIPDKNDILDAFTHVRRAGPNATDSLWMFSAISIENTVGSRYFDFELYQTDITYNRTTQTWSGYGPADGHTVWTFDAAGNILTPGDIVFTAEFSSSSITLVEARIWINRASLSMTPTTFNWGGAFDGAAVGSTYGYANILPKTAGAFYTGIQNTVPSTWAGPFALVRLDNSLVTSYIPRQFMEFSVNLTKLGIEPASFTTNACGSPFRRVLIKTRSSTSFTSELKDFIAPYRMFDYPNVDADAFVRYFCGTMPTTNIQVYNPNATSIYNWSTSNGTIVGSTTGTSITVSAPGTYYVTQQMHAQCPLFASDSVEILYDTVCKVLNVDITRFNANRLGRDAELRWQINNNELAAYYVIEYSTDNRTYNELATIPANDRNGIADYTFRYLLNNDPTVFYRIKVIGKNSVVKYSSTVLLRSDIESRSTPLIFPNPAQGEAWMSMDASRANTVSVFISDMTGRLIKTIKLPVKQGNNLLPLNGLTEQVPGMYIVKVKGVDGETTQKVLVNK